MECKAKNKWINTIHNIQLRWLTLRHEWSLSYFEQTHLFCVLYKMSCLCCCPCTLSASCLPHWTVRGALCSTLSLQHLHWIEMQWLFTVAHPILTEDGWINYSVWSKSSPVCSAGHRWIGCWNNFKYTMLNECSKSRSIFVSIHDGAQINESCCFYFES